MTTDKPEAGGPIAHFALEHYRFIRASGPDTKTFLQGQVTCDTSKISPSRSVPGALCNLKGRAIANFRALEVDGDVLLQVSAGLQDKVLAILKKYAVFSKLTLSVEDNFQAIGLHIPVDAEGDAAQQLMGVSIPADLGAASPLPDGGAILRTELRGRAVIGLEVWGSIERLDALGAKLSNLGTSGITASWIEAENLSGIAHITEVLSEEYTPALLNYDLSGVVDFKKGCYTGQEIVARMFYRSTPKKRLFALRAQTPLGASLAIVDQSGANESLGEAFSITTHSALAILPVDAAQRKLVSSEGESLEALELIYPANEV